MASVISENCILVDLDVNTKLDAIVKMTDTLDKYGYLKDREQYLNDVLEREKIFPTCIGFEIGLPHGRSSGVINVGLSIARLKNNITWSEETQEQVNIIILIAVNDQDGNNTHMQLLAKLSRMLMHEEFRNQIMDGDAKSICELINENVLLEED